MKKQIRSIALALVLLLGLSLPMSVQAAEWEYNFARYITINLNGGSSGSMGYWSSVDRTGCGYTAGQWVADRGIGGTYLDKNLKKHTVVGYNDCQFPCEGTFYQHCDFVGITPHVFIQTPSRHGYNFAGFSSNTGFFESGGYYYFEVGCYTANKGNVSITALWNPWQHTVKYDANGGSGAPSEQTKTYGSSLTLSSKKPTRTGYTFKGWKCSKGGTYQPGGAYNLDYNGGTVTMKAIWADETKPSISNFTATPNSWSAGNGTVTITARDKGSGIDKIELYRKNVKSGATELIKTYKHSGTTDSVTDTYTQKAEGVYQYTVYVYDKAGNVSSKTSSKIYLDHSNPVMSGLNQTNTNWTNIAPVIKVSATDYLSGTSYGGSGVNRIEVYDDAGRKISSASNNLVYTIPVKYEGSHTFTVYVFDNVGHRISQSVRTNYDVTKPYIAGTDIATVVDDRHIAGYCQDNVLSQHTDDLYSRSVNGANNSSGLKSVGLYQIKGNSRILIDTQTTKKAFASANTNNAFELYYDVNSMPGQADYYEMVVTDFAGNITKKKLTPQNALLKTFHTSIDRSSYEN